MLADFYWCHSKISMGQHHYLNLEAIFPQLKRVKSCKVPLAVFGWTMPVNDYVGSSESFEAVMSLFEFHRLKKWSSVRTFAEFLN